MYFLQMQLLLTEKVMFGSPVVVNVYAHSMKTHIITIPSLEEGDTKSCNGTLKDTLHAQI